MPDDVHQRLKAQAALAGQSVDQFLLARRNDMASMPTLPELAQHIRERTTYTSPPSAATIRAERERR
jgi:hypothetical protein